MTLSEFLLARIADDEERAKYAGPHYDDCEHFHYFSEGGLPCTCGLEDRLVAECKAKRRIVSAYSGNSVVNGLLALPYADHPDYQKEWAL